MFIPENFRSNITDSFGGQGIIWLESLPLILNQVAEKWQLSEVQPMHNLSYNYVAISYSAKYHTKIVIKVACDRKEFEREILTLQFWSGSSCVKLIDYDLELECMIIEHLIPATSLKSLFPAKDAQASLIAARLMLTLHEKEAPTNLFPTIRDWLKDLESKGNLPQHPIDRAKKLSAELLASRRRQVLLHGDLHHENILSNGKAWVVIDPKGVVGEAEYEVGAFIRNPMPDLLKAPDPAGILASRIDIFTDLLGFDKQRIKDWSYVQSVLAAAWGGEHQDEWLKVAEIIEGL